MKTLIVNLFAGSSAGKSSNAYSITGILKMMGVECEYVPEFAKDLCFDGREKILDIQPYVFDKQLKKITCVNEKTNVIICDSPLLLSAIYDKENDENFESYVVKTFNKFKNYNIFLNRGEIEFSSVGRVDSDKEEQLKFDEEIKAFLLKHEIPYVEEVNIKGLDQLENCKRIAEDIISRLVVEKLWEGK